MCGVRMLTGVTSFAFIHHSQHDRFRDSSTVPTRLKRYYNSKQLHFITCSCYHRIPFLRRAQRRDLSEVLSRPAVATALPSWAMWSRPSTSICSSASLRPGPRGDEGGETAFCMHGAQAPALLSHKTLLWLRVGQLGTSWQKRLYDGNCGARQLIGTPARHASEPSAARVGGGTGSVALEQLPFLCLCRARSDPGEFSGTPRGDQDAAMPELRESAPQRPLVRNVPEGMSHPPNVELARSRTWRDPVSVDGMKHWSGPSRRIPLQSL